MARVSLSEFRAIQKRAKIRKEKRIAKAKELWPKRPAKIKTISQWKALRDQCDVLVSILVRMRDPVCRICAVKPAALAYHIIPRGSLSTRWDLQNVVGACLGCNNGERWHRLKYADKHKEIFGAEVYEKLRSKSKEQVKFDVSSLKDLREILRIKIQTRDLFST